jgi:hypothetical protein
MPLPSKADVSKLDALSAEYQTHWREWKELDLLNSGGSLLRDAIGIAGSSILVKRPKEPNDVYSQRAARFTYQPILPNVVSWYAAKMFEKEASITGQPNTEFWQNFTSDCDRAGTSLRNFSADIFETSFVFSSAYVLTDLPRKSDSGAKVESLADQQRAGLLNPYLTVYDPLSVVNYKADRYGQLEWIILKTVSVEPSFLDKAKTVTEWRYFDQQEFGVYQSVSESSHTFVWDSTSVMQSGASAELIDSGKHALYKQNRVPVRRIIMRKPMRLARRAYSQLLDHLNQDNTYAWALFNANLAMPYFIGADMGTPTLSEVGWFDLPAGSSVGWLEPTGATFDHAQKRLDSLRQEIYRSFHLQAQGRDSTATAASSSGYSKELDMAPAQDMLDAFGEFMRGTVQQILTDVSDANGEDPKVISVAWPRYDSTVALEEIALGEGLDTIDVQSDTLYKVRDRRVAMAYMEDEAQELKDTVAEEIENAPGRSVQQAAQRQAQVLQFQQSLQKAGDRSLAKDQITEQDNAVEAA